MHQLTCSIVLYNNDVTTLSRVIECVLRSNIGTKLYLIDNSETDVLKTLASDKSIEYIFNNRNVGYGAAHNIAIRKTINESEYHLVLNPDVYFEPHVLKDLYEFAVKNPFVGHIMPKIFYPDGSVQYVAKLIPAPLNLIIRLIPFNLLKRYNDRYELKFTGYNKLMEVPYLSGCFMFLKCSALKEIGLFDERFFMYPEDIDLSRRMHKKYKTVFYPYASIVHEHAKSSFKNLRMFWIHVTNMIKYFNKWGWLFDRERRHVNKVVLKQLNYK